MALTLALSSEQGVAQVAASAESVPVDRSPHVERFIDVNGARLQLLDWGGDGPVLVFMPGFGNGAHIFDDLAPAFSDRFHSLALTPRGFPPSSAPDSGYTVTQLAEDIRGVLDSLQVSKAVLVGHSISGAVLTRFAGLYPNRLLAAVYLDGAYDFGDAYRRSQEAKREGPQPPADTMAAAFQSWRRRFPDWDSVREIDAGMWNIDSTETARRQVLVKSLVTEVRSHPNEIWRVQAPALSLCAVGSMERGLGWLTPDSARWERPGATRRRPDGENALSVSSLLRFVTARLWSLIAATTCSWINGWRWCALCGDSSRVSSTTIRFLRCGARSFGSAPPRLRGSYGEF